MSEIDCKCKSESQFARQCLFEKGLKKFGKEGEAAGFKEAKQLHDRRCFAPTLPKKMSNKERNGAQTAPMCLTQKRDGAVKGCMVCNGEPTREWVGRKETASPTATTESMFLTAMTDACEARDVVSTDVPNAFVQTPLDVEDGDERIVMKIAGVLVDALLNNDPDLHGGFAVHEKGRK